MGRSTWKYQVFFLFCLILHSQLPFPSSLSTSFSSMPPCSALLHFNKSFSLEKSASEYHPSYPKTASWQEDKHCCTWDGVECDKNTSLVVGLDLTSSWLYGNILSNSTLFFLPNLRRLNLADNDFNDSLISAEFGNFKSLTHLNLSYSVFSGQIPFEISQLSSLVSLDLSQNGLLIKAPVWKRVIDNLTQLRELILDYTNMSSTNSLMKNLSSSLTTLSLRECDLQGKLENNILCLPSIQTLDLTDNSNLEGSLLKSNWSCSSLKHLALPYCNFTGSIPASLGYLTKLTYLDLLSNSFSGLLPSSLFNLPNLSTLDLGYNQLVGPLPSHVHNAYSIIQEDYQASRQDHHAHNSIPQVVWNLIWKVKIPLKIGIFEWKVMHDSIPTFLNLCNRGINVRSTCPLCNSEDESSTHLFLYCPFARTIWHGSSLGIHTSELNNVSVQGWVGSLLIRHKRMDQESMKYLQTLFTVLWSIWNHRNLVVHEDKQPNPIEVLLTAQILLYHEIFNEADSLGTHRHQQNADQIPIGVQWQLIVKLAGAKRKRAKRSAYAYEARYLQGEVVFCGIRSCATGSFAGAVQETIVEAVVKAKNLGYQ